MCELGQVLPFSQASAIFSTQIVSYQPIPTVTLSCDSASCGDGSFCQWHEARFPNDSSQLNLYCQQDHDFGEFIFKTDDGRSIPDLLGDRFFCSRISECLENFGGYYCDILHFDQPFPIFGGFSESVAVGEISRIRISSCCFNQTGSTAKTKDYSPLRQSSAAAKKEISV